MIGALAVALVVVLSIALVGALDAVHSHCGTRLATARRVPSGDPSLGSVNKP